MVQGKKWKDTSLKDFDADMNLYLSSHLFKRDDALISSLWTKEVSLSLMAKAVAEGELKVQMVSQAYTRSKRRLGLGCKFLDSLSNNQLSGILFIDFVVHCAIKLCQGL